MRLLLLLLAALLARAGAPAAPVRLTLWRVRQAESAWSAAAQRPGSWLHPVVAPPVDDEQLYNHRDACAPGNAMRPAAAARSPKHPAPRLNRSARAPRAARATGNTTASWAWARRRSRSRCCATQAAR